MLKPHFDSNYSNFVTYSSATQLSGVAIFSTLPFVGTILMQILTRTENLYRFLQVLIEGYTFINAHIHQSQLIDSTPYRARRIFLTDFYNSGHPD
jgi:exonuclease III